MPLLGGGICLPHAINVTDQKITGAIGESHGEEEYAALDFDSTIS